MVDALLPDSSPIDVGACDGQRHGEALIGTGDVLRCESFDDAKAAVCSGALNQPDCDHAARRRAAKRADCRRAHHVDDEWSFRRNVRFPRDGVPSGKLNEWTRA